ncbi:uncharacterized protein LOC130940277 isoform X2 [Arachis stenosperma]|uniref:uncharacterized protein LOC130940277 isoform X2 n=1 Tax=Arachis stenosperma TaxID=217475 RepID=UPI0025AB9349|nr:uncharacterized protein LOC130940277 isoform X2 [Arachis stenosperma]
MEPEPSIQYDASSSENMGDTGLPPVPIPNESTSIRSLTALPPVPAPQRNTRKLASRGQRKRQAVEEAPVDDSAETETDEVVLDPRYKLQLIKWSFEKLYEKEDAKFLTSKVKETLFKVFDSYRLFGGDYLRSTRQDPPEISTQELEAHETSFAMEFEKEMQFNAGVNKN